MWVGGKEGGLLALTNSSAGSGPTAKIESGFGPRNEKEKAEKDDDAKKDKAENEAPPTAFKKGLPPRGNSKVTGAVYSIGKSGNTRKLVQLPKRAAVDMAVAGDDIFIATDQGGKVYRCSADSPDYAISFDLDASQALSLLADSKGLSYIGVGAPAQLVRVKRSSPQKASYISDVLDAEFPAMWGAIDHFADGNFKISTRSGNIKDPERGWTKWTRTGSGDPAEIKSGDSRYIQVKVEWVMGSKATLSSLSIPYRIYNQPHYIEQIDIDENEKDSLKGKNGKSKTKPVNGKNGNSDIKHSSERKISWKVENPDKDDLSYELFFSAGRYKTVDRDKNRQGRSLKAATNGKPVLSLTDGTG